MQKNSIGFIIGLVISVGLVAYYGYLIFSSTTTASNAPVTVASDLKSDLLDDPLFTALREKNPNGSFPITVDKAELGKANPFQ